jgi:hypothetical protein
VAEQLAAQSEEVAAAIEVNNGCAATERAAELRATLETEEVPEAIRREVERVAGREFICAPPAPPPPPPPATVPADDDDDDEDGGRGRDKRDKKGKGDEDD